MFVRFTYQYHVDIEGDTIEDIANKFMDLDLHIHDEAEPYVMDDDYDGIIDTVECSEFKHVDVPGFRC